MLRFSAVLVTLLALMGAMTVAVLPAAAYTGAAYDKCMAKCQKSGVTNSCSKWCEQKH